MLKNKKFLIGVGVIIVAMLVFIITQLLSGSPTRVIDEAPVYRAPSIDFDFLESSTFKNLSPYERIGPLLEEDIGRENPFIPY